MKKLVVIICLLSISFLFAGCVTQNSGTTEEPFKNISLESNVVELAYANITTHTNDDFNEDLEPILVVEKVDVNYLFHNIAGRSVSVSVTVEYYDKNNNILYTGGPRTINNLPKDYTETNIAGPNTISYDGAHVADVDHVKIIAIEI